MRIGLNLLHAHKDVGGVWNYIQVLVEALGKYDHENQYICYCTAESEPLIPRKENFKIERVAFSGENRLKRILYENTVLAIRVKRDKLDGLHWFANTLGFFCPVPSVVTIYDLMVYENPEDYSTLHRFYLKAMIPRTVRLATALAPMSKSTADAVHSRFKTKCTHSVVIPPILKDAFKPASHDEINAFKIKYNLPAKFWLYVAHFYPHKNHSRLFQAYADMKGKSDCHWPLVLRGDKKGRDERIARLLTENQIVDDVIWLPRLNDLEMPLLYSSASALIFPSTFEGGGIPVVEAMACGCPVAASRIPTNIEFAGDAALLFDPFQVDSISGTMQDFNHDRDLRTYHRERGLLTSENLRSSKIAELLINTYKKTFQDNP